MLQEDEINKHVNDAKQKMQKIDSQKVAHDGMLAQKKNQLTECLLHYKSSSRNRVPKPTHRGQDRPGTLNRRGREQDPRSNRLIDRLLACWASHFTIHCEVLWVLVKHSERDLHRYKTSSHRWVLFRVRKLLDPFQALLHVSQLQLRAGNHIRDQRARGPLGQECIVRCHCHL